jgi:argininosuccinate synthase
VNVVPKQIVLAYSGGLDTSVIMRWLIETYHCPVVAFVANVGQQEDLEAIAQKAQQTGASQVCVEDVREAFVRDFVFPALRAHAVYEGNVFARHLPGAAAYCQDPGRHSPTGRC